LHDLNLLKVTVTPFEGKGCFLTRYSKGQTKPAHRQLNKFRNYFLKQGKQSNLCTGLDRL